MRILITIRKEEVVTNIYRDVKDNILRKIINAQQEKSCTKEGASINNN